MIENIAMVFTEDNKIVADFARSFIELISQNVFSSDVIIEDSITTSSGTGSNHLMGESTPLLQANGRPDLN